MGIKRGLKFRKGNGQGIFQSGTQMKIFWSEMEYVTKGRRKFRNEELERLYSLSNIIRLMISRRVKWAGHAACMEKKINFYWLWVGHLK